MWRTNFRVGVGVMRSKGLLAVVVVVGVMGLGWMIARNRDAAPPADAVPVLRVVGLFPLTGPGASLGDYLRNGVELAREDLVVELGDRLRVDVEIVDSKNQPREGVSALKAEVSRRRPDAIISGMSSVSAAIAPIAEQEGILTIVTTTALTGLPQGKKTIVRLYPTSNDFVESVATHLASQFARIGVFYVHDDFGDSNQKRFVEIVQGAGRTVTAAEPFELGQTDSRSVIARVLATNPQAVFVTGYGPSYIALFKQLKEARPTLPVFTEIAFANPSVLAALGADADGIVFNGTPLESASGDVPAVETFRRRYREKFKAEPYMVAGFAYDSLMLIARAALAKRPPTKADVVAQSPYKGMMGTIQFDAEGENRIPLGLLRRENGRSVAVRE